MDIIEELNVDMMINSGNSSPIQTHQNTDFMNALFNALTIDSKNN